MKDKNELIFGRRWSDVQNAQQGGRLDDLISAEIVKPSATEKDIELLNKHGSDGLEVLQLFGVLDRLRTSGIV